MKKIPKAEMTKALDWCVSVFGPLKVMSDHSNDHPGHESATCRIHGPMGFCYLKVHSSEHYWNNEVHAYEKWACAFGGFAPRLLAVHDEEPLALVISELHGYVAEEAQLPPSEERAIWRAAGAALVKLHDLGTGTYFGPCLRDGIHAEEPTKDAREYVTRRLRSQIERAVRGRYLNGDELATLQAAYDLIPAFESENPIPCHRDYCTANWLISKDGTWSGVIDFEFSCWDVRVADFSRYPDWSWIDRPDLIDAFSEGYGRPLTTAEEQQLLVAHAEYALSAIIWGRDSSFSGFEREGRESLARLASLLK